MPGRSRSSNFVWVRGQETDLSGGLELGGYVQKYIAGATLLVGDAVYLSAAATVNKTLVAATNLAAVGIVVGGFRTNFDILQDDALIGVQQAGLVNEDVLVCVMGKCKALSDAAITLGNKITAASATTAGRIKAGTVTTDLAAGDSGRLLGMALTTVAGAGLVVTVMVHLH